MYPCATFLATDGTLRNIFRTMFCQAQPTIVHSMKQLGTLILVSPPPPPPTSTHLHPPPPISICQATLKILQVYSPFNPQE